MTTMIALIGEQQLPNFLPVCYYKPTHVLLVYTQRTEPQYKKLKAVFERKKAGVSGNKTGQDVEVFGVKTDAYDIVLIRDVINKELDEKRSGHENKKFAQAIKASTEPPVFNLTGGTKTMLLAVYQIAQQYKAPTIYLQSEGKNIRVYHYIWEDEQLRYHKSEFLPELMTLNDIFDMHFGPGQWQRRSERQNQGSDGHLFERAVASTLEAHGFEVMSGVRALQGQIDVDIAVRSKNQYGLMEAKIGSKVGGIKGIQQLHTAARYLGTYSRMFYVITGFSEPSQSELVKLANIQVISILNYDGTANAIPPESEDAKGLISAVENVLQG